eukprot:gene5484-981_t
MTAPRTEVEIRLPLSFYQRILSKSGLDRTLHRVVQPLAQFADTFGMLCKQDASVWSQLSVAQLSTDSCTCEDEACCDNLSPGSSMMYTAKSLKNLSQFGDGSAEFSIHL